MDVREKLVELLQNAKAAMKSENLSCDIARNMFVVDFMMENGVTVQEWTSVDDMLPDPKENAICINRHGDMMIGTYTEWGWMFPCYFESPTHWMQLPPLPKGE